VKNVNLPSLIIFLLLLVGTNALTYTLASSNEPESSTKASVTSEKKLNYNTVEELLNNVAQLFGKEVTVTGKVVQTQSEYYLVGTAKPPSAIKLDFSKSGIDPNTLVNSKQNSQKVAGTLSTVDKKTVLVVSSVN
jgi:hypothetical protein